MRGKPHSAIAVLHHRASESRGGRTTTKSEITEVALPSLSQPEREGRRLRRLYAAHVAMHRLWLAENCHHIMQMHSDIPASLACAREHIPHSAVSRGQPRHRGILASWTPFPRMCRVRGLSCAGRVPICTHPRFVTFPRRASPHPSLADPTAPCMAMASWRSWDNLHRLHSCRFGSGDNAKTTSFEMGAHLFEIKQNEAPRLATAFAFCPMRGFVWSTPLAAGRLTRIQRSLAPFSPHSLLHLHLNAQVNVFHRHRYAYNRTN